MKENSMFVLGKAVLVSAWRKLKADLGKVDRDDKVGNKKVCPWQFRQLNSGSKQVLLVVGSYGKVFGQGDTLYCTTCHRPSLKEALQYIWSLHKDQIVHIGEDANYYSYPSRVQGELLPLIGVALPKKPTKKLTKKPAKKATKKVAKKPAKKAKSKKAVRK